MSDLPPPFDAVWFRFIVGFIVGGSLGSFVTMLAYRLPRRLSIITPPSHCPSCGHHLAACDLVPMLSWLWTRGQCRYCHKKIGLRYLGIELAISLACALSAVLVGPLL